MTRPKIAFGIFDLAKKESMAGYGEVGFAAILRFYDLPKPFDRELATSYLQHGAYQASYHAPQKAVGLYLVNGKASLLLYPLTILYGAIVGPDLGIAFCKAGKVCIVKDHTGRLLHGGQVEGIGKVVGPVVQKGRFCLVYKILILPGYGIKAAMRGFPHRNQAANGYIRGQHGVEVVYHFLGDLVVYIEMKIVLPGMNACIGAG